MWLSSGSGKLSIELTEEQINSVPRSGPADAAIEELLASPSVRYHCIDLWSREDLISELREYGCWDESELELDKGENIRRMLWILICDAHEELASTER